jgi:GNAT superfamily N-acetyltransferase
MFDTVTERPYLAKIYTDSLTSPSACLLLFGHYLFAGGCISERLMSDFIEAELSGIKAENLHMIVVFYDKDDKAVTEQLKSRFLKVFDGERSLYRINKPLTASADKTKLTRINVNLLNSGVRNLEMITSEVLGTATYDSMDDFCKNGIGYTYIDGGRICAFCTSEYQSKSSVAIGIEVEEKYQKKGVAAEMTRAFITEASSCGLDVFWECWKENIPSVKTALKCGFDKVADYPVLVIVFC